MKRDIYQKLLQWKSSKQRKPLILRGARQVGKTYILKQFGQHEYKNVVYINFEEDPALDDFFRGRLVPEKILANLSLYTGENIEPGTTLLIFDEIQNSSHALNSLKYFCEDAPEYHLAAAGSLIGLFLSGPKSFPVGKVNFLSLYPLTILEFLEAVGKPQLRNLIENTTDFSPYPKPFHNELKELLRLYFFIGGMPEVVKHYIDTGDYSVVRNTQRDIIESYLLDFAKHGITAAIPKINLIWNSIPSQLAKENKKFVFSAVKKSARAREYESALQWLEDAGLIYRSFQISNPKFPLKGYANPQSFKVFLLDVGILGALANLHSGILLKGDELFQEFKGAWVENYVAQQLKSKTGISLFYWTSTGKKAELDFLCEFETQIYPLEVKTGINPRSKSLQSYDRQFGPPVLSRTTLLNLKKDGKVVNYPLYAIHLFPKLSSQMK